MLAYLSWCEGHADAKVSDLNQVSSQLLGALKWLGNQQVVRLDVTVHHAPDMCMGKEECSTQVPKAE